MWPCSRRGSPAQVERLYPRSIARARTRVAEVQSTTLFDAAIGRFILQFVPDAVAAVRRLSQLFRPGGVLVFQQVSYAPLLAISAHLSLWSACCNCARDGPAIGDARNERGSPPDFRGSGPSCAHCANGSSAWQHSGVHFVDLRSPLQSAAANPKA